MAQPLQLQQVAKEPHLIAEVGHVLPVLLICFKLRLLHLWERDGSGSGQVLLVPSRSRQTALKASCSLHWRGSVAGQTH